MTDYKELRKILNGSNMSVKHYQNDKIVIADASNFRGMPMSALEEAQELVEKSIKEDTLSLAKKGSVKTVDTLADITNRAEQNIGVILDCLQSKKPMTAEEIRKKAQSPIGIRDSILNGRWNVNNSADPTRANLALPNVYLSPWEANS